MAAATEEIVTTEETQETGAGPKQAMGKWMTSLGDLDTPPSPPPPPPAPKKEPTDEPPAAQPPGTGAAPAAGQPVAPAVPPADTKPGAPAAAAAAVPAAEEKKETDEGEDKLPRTKQDWDKFKTRRKEKETALQAQIAERDAKLKEWEGKQKEWEGKLAEAAKTPAAAPEELQGYQKQLEEAKKLNDQLSERIALLDVTQDPRFQEYFSNKITEQFDLAKQLVGQENAAAVEQALKLPDTPEYREMKKAQLNELMSNMDVFDQKALLDVVGDLAKINREREGEIKKYSDLRTAKQAKDAETMQQMAATRDRVLNDAVKAYRDQGMAVYVLRDNDSTWNQGVEQRLALAKRMLTGEGLKPQEIAKAALDAAALPMLLQSWKSDVEAKDAEIKKLQEQMKTLQAAQPTGGSSQPTTQGGDQGMPIKLGMRPDEALRAWTRNTWQDQQ